MFGNGPQVNERHLFSLLMFSLSICCFSIILLSSNSTESEWYIVSDRTKNDFLKEVIRMPGAVTGRCRRLQKSSVFVHLFAKLIFFSSSKPNNFLPMAFQKKSDDTTTTAAAAAAAAAPPPPPEQKHEWGWCGSKGELRWGGQKAKWEWKPHSNLECHHLVHVWGRLLVLRLDIQLSGSSKALTTQPIVW